MIARISGIVHPWRYFHRVLTIQASIPDLDHVFDLGTRKYLAPAHCLSLLTVLTFQIYRINNKKLTANFDAARKRVLADIQRARAHVAEPLRTYYHGTTVSRIRQICTNGLGKEIECKFWGFFLFFICFLKVCWCLVQVRYIAFYSRYSFFSRNINALNRCLHISSLFSCQ